MFSALSEPRSPARLHSRAPSEDGEILAEPLSLVKQTVEDLFQDQSPGLEGSSIEGGDEESIKKRKSKGKNTV